MSLKVKTEYFLWVLLIPIFMIFASSGEAITEPITDDVYLFYYDVPREEWYEMEVLTTAYNSLPEQTDSTPFITASGTQTRDGIVACNCLPFGTVIEIDGKFYEVEDRMNSRYTCDGIWKVDIWMEHYEDAKQYGKQTTTIKIYK